MHDMHLLTPMGGACLSRNLSVMHDTLKLLVESVARSLAESLMENTLECLLRTLPASADGGALNAVFGDAPGICGRSVPLLAQLLQTVEIDGLLLHQTLQQFQLVSRV